jgi:hypothetical protein
MVILLMPSLPNFKPTETPHHGARPRRAVRRRRIEQLDFFKSPRPPPRPFDLARLTEIALHIWAASGPVRGTSGEAFFRSRRLAVPGPDVVRFHPALKHGDDRAQGLVFLLRDERTSEPCGCIRIFLDDSGWAVAKKPLGRTSGASVMPRPP